MEQRVKAAREQGYATRLLVLNKQGRVLIDNELSASGFSKREYLNIPESEHRMMDRIVNGTHSVWSNHGQLK